jgi:hypothetical protein
MHGRICCRWLVGCIVLRTFDNIVSLVPVPLGLQAWPVAGLVGALAAGHKHVSHKGRAVGGVAAVLTLTACA